MCIIYSYAHIRLVPLLNGAVPEVLYNIRQRGNKICGFMVAAVLAKWVHNGKKGIRELVASATPALYDEIRKWFHSVILEKEMSPPPF